MLYATLAVLVELPVSYSVGIGRISSNDGSIDGITWCAKRFVTGPE